MDEPLALAEELQNISNSLERMATVLTDIARQLRTIEAALAHTTPPPTPR
jgi:hypothetical protein